MGSELSNIFKIKYDLTIRRNINEKISFEFVDKIYDILKKYKINSVVVMGDTLTGTAGAIAAYLNKSKNFYIESGLRTGDYNQLLASKKVLEKQLHIYQTCILHPQSKIKIF